MPVVFLCFISITPNLAFCTAVLSVSVFWFHCGPMTPELNLCACLVILLFIFSFLLDATFLSNEHWKAIVIPSWHSFRSWGMNVIFYSFTWYLQQFAVLVHAILFVVRNIDLGLSNFVLMIHACYVIALKRHWSGTVVLPRKIRICLWAPCRNIAKTEKYLSNLA